MSQQLLTPRDFIEDILEMCDRIRQFTDGATKLSFLDNVMMQFSVIRAFEILGEASKQLKDILPDVQSRFPDLPFAKMYALRNRFIHGYDSVEPAIVWEIVVTDIPAVRSAAQTALDNWPADLT